MQPKHTNDGPWSDERVTAPDPIIRGGALRLVTSGTSIVAFMPMWLDTPEEAAEARANARLFKTAAQLLADLKTATAKLREYEALHRAKGTADSARKAEVNAGLAARFEATIAMAEGA